MKTFVIGDIHGAYKALVQCLERSGFDYEKDKLICLGDVADGWMQPVECFEELFKIRNLVYVRGNHDQWLKDWLKEGKQPLVWTMQGGKNTLNSYIGHEHKLWKKHLDFLKTTEFFYKDEQNRVFVHGGIKPGVPVEENTKMYLSWDRDLWDKRHEYERVDEYKEVYVGHTSIWKFSHFPLWNGNVCFMDTGGGWEGKLSIMDIDSKKFWQSDLVSQLYPRELGRGNI